ncbi:MAG: chromate efflux transporter, partial [Burkholderiales bacterium]
MQQSTPLRGSPSPGSVAEVFKAFLVLGLTSFGGPVAHIGYFREAFVARRKWLDEAAYADLVALSQFTPGPASSKVGIAIGLARAGLPGALAAWVGFTLPSALALILFAYGVDAFAGDLNAGWLQGLAIVAVAVVAQAVWGMAKNLCPDAHRFTVAVFASVLVTTWPTSMGQVAAIAIGALAGWLFLAGKSDNAYAELDMPFGKAAGAVCLALFFALLIGLPVAAGLYPGQALAVFDSFYRSGSLVFGGGHVVLPLLQSEVVPHGWVTNDRFLAGYGAAQAVPGPLFTFAAYLGTIMTSEPNGWSGAVLCIVAIFLPGFLLMVGVVPYWNRLRRLAPVRSALAGVNAAVVGLLLAALYHPVWTSAIQAPADFALGLV